ncbi:MAG: hypothetical protein ABSE89_02925 [Sedimentisphaerales bacterium]
MASITFNCPNCKALCAFRDIYKGRRARCLQCNQIFIIPDKDGDSPKKIKQPKEFDEPLPGFYEAVFKKSLAAIFSEQSLPMLVFIFVVTTLKFFVAHLNYSFTIPCRGGGTIAILLPIGSAIAILVWGGILWCYAEIIYSTAFDIESLPQITFGGGFGYLFSALGALYSFFVALVVVFLPVIITKFIFYLIGFELHWLIFLLAAIGGFLFPMAVLTVSIGRDLTMLFRPDYFFVPIKNAFRHYLFIAILFAILCWLQFMTRNYGDVANTTVLLNLAAVLAVQILGVFVMRIIGLFYRHFGCYFNW